MSLYCQFEILRRIADRIKSEAEQSLDGSYVDWANHLHTEITIAKRFHMEELDELDALDNE